MKKIFSMFIAGMAALSLVSCADKLVDENIDPANVTETKPEALLTAAINAFQPCDYLIWWYDVNYFTRWSQMGTPSSGFAEDYTSMAEYGGMGSQYLNVMKYRERISQYASQINSQKYDGYLAATSIMTVYLAIFDTDMYGDIPYTEACKYESDGIITPNYDKMENLYQIWIDELNDDIKKCQESDLDQLQREDPAYGCDWAKWAKLANSLKLKIAVRLYNNNPSEALSIAQEAASNSAGLITDINDDFRFNKATSKATGDNDYVYGTGNYLNNPNATDEMKEFLLKSKDPRIRFIFYKNGYNSKIVQCFIDNDKWDDLPSQVKANVVLDADGNFKEWGGMGEPWVRYTTKPVVFSPKENHGEGKAITDDEYTEYFDYGTRYQVKVGETTKSFNPFVTYNEEMRRGRCTYTVPTAPGDAVIEDTEQNPLYIMYMGAGEVDLYMAEFAELSGSSIGGKTAEEWYNAGVEASVRELDALAAANKIPYYGTTYSYDPNEKVIDLQDGEIEAMMETDNVKYTGTKAEKLEKIYLQELIHFSHMPDDQYVTARRSGYPKVGSTIWPFIKFNGVELAAIPRRFEIAEPANTDLMYDIKTAAYKEQGFEHLGSNNSGITFNSSSSPLNTERVWFDKNAPQWGSPTIK